MMTIEQAIQTSDYSSATHIDTNGYGYYVDGSTDGYDLSSGVDGMPAALQGHYETIEEVKKALPSEIVASERWEAASEEV